MFGWCVCSIRLEIRVLMLVSSCLCLHACVQLLSMAANKTEKEFAIELGLTEDDLVDAFEEHLAKKPKDESGSAASSGSAAAVTQ